MVSLGFDFGFNVVCEKCVVLKLWTKILEIQVQIVLTWDCDYREYKLYIQYKNVQLQLTHLIFD